jgi:aconitate hydratase
MLSASGALNDIIASGARILECACGPCIGMGFSPNSAGVSLRTFNRNFLGRSGTKDAGVYLVSPETAVAAALTGEITDPRLLGDMPEIEKVDKFFIDDSAVVAPADEETAKDLQVVRGPNIKPFPKTYPLENEIEVTVGLKVGDNITTDHIMPAGAKILPYRSNIPYLSKFCFSVVDESYCERALSLKSSVIVGGDNYGQGSSREHAALVPLYLGVKAVIVKSFARIHVANLINAGIVPLIFANPADYEDIEQGDKLVLSDVFNGMDKGEITLKNVTKNKEYTLDAKFTARQKDILKAGGLLAYTKGE